MNVRKSVPNFWSRLYIGLLGLTSLAVLAPPLAAPAAHAWSAYSANEYEKSVDDLWRQKNAKDSRLSDADFQAYFQNLAVEISSLGARDFNHLLEHLAQKYAENPTQRSYLEGLFALLHASVQPELERREESHPALVVIRDVLIVGVGAYGLGYGPGAIKGLLAVRGTGLLGRERMLFILSHLPQGRQYPLKLAGLTGVTAALDATNDFLSTQKLDPIFVLRATQRGILYNLAKSAAITRDTLKRIQPRDLKANLAKYRTQLDKTERLIRSVDQQVDGLAKAAPEFRSDIEPIAQDLKYSEFRAGWLQNQLRQLLLRDDL